MIRRPIKPATSVCLSAIAIAVLLLGYAWLSHRQHQINPDDLTIPTWSQLAHGVVRAVSIDPITNQRALLVDAWATYSRLAVGLGFAVVLAMIIGLGMGCYAAIEALLLPIMSFAAKIPPTAMLAVFFVLVGMNEGFFLSIIAFGIIPTLAQSIYEAVRKDVPEELLHKASTLGASQLELIWNVIFRILLPRLIESVRLQIGPAMVFLIAAEWVITDVGFGYRLRIESRKVHMDIVYFYIAMLGASGFLFDYILKKLRSKCCKWYEL